MSQPPCAALILNLSEQEALTQRALELLALPDDDQVKLLLDVGCGSGLSGQALTEKGHVWMVSMTPIANLDFGWKLTTSQSVAIQQIHSSIHPARHMLWQKCFMLV